jgi:hypothetical protein
MELLSGDSLLDLVAKPGGGATALPPDNSLLLPVVLALLTAAVSLPVPFPVLPFPAVTPFPKLPFQVATLEFNTAPTLPALLLPVFPVLLAPTADTLEDAKSGQSMELDPGNPLPPFAAPTLELLVPLATLLVDV